MVVTINWLREHLDTKLNAQEIISTLEDLGLNLKIGYLNNKLWDELEIVKIIKKEPHPNADKLNLYTIQQYNEEELTIICGDPNLKIGNYVIYAKPGIQMPSGIKLKVAKIRGIDSKGMLCSANEINLPIQSSGVLKCFKEDFGKTVAKAYEEEGIFEIELTPNRCDAFSIRGIANILANESYGELKEYNIIYTKAQNKELIKIKSNECKGIYCALFKHNIKPTPAKIVKRLQLTNHNVLDIDLVDYTNYLSHELGQPMHIFDYEKINKSDISVENLEKKQKFITLAKEKVELDENSLVFKENGEIIGWPCCIGGENSKVDQNSKYILFETGIYKSDPMQRRKHKIVTSASKRTEYGLNPFCLKDVANKFLNLANAKPEYIQELAFNEKKSINFDFNQIERIIGIKVEKKEFEAKMTKKGFIFNKDGTITPPNYKFFDINTANCIVEEFAINMYKDLKSLNLSPAYPKHGKKENILSNLALNEGFFECKNISLTNKEDPEFNISEQGRSIKNYSNLNYSILRGSLIPDLLKNFSWHVRNKYKYYNFFENGLIYGEHYPNKQLNIFTAISNNQAKIRTLLTKILSIKNISDKITIKYTEDIGYSNHACKIYYNDQLIAIIATLKTSILEKYNLTECYSLEIMHDAFYSIKAQQNNNFITTTFPIYKDYTFIFEGKSIRTTLSPVLFNYLNTKNIKYNIKSIYDIENTRKITIEFMFHEKDKLSTEQIQDKLNLIIMNINNQTLKLN